ncbi:ArsR/SmtB family transcription factor [Natronoglycomyces albus]|uniref:Helix-turn-helix transcriptional regulator n=1 Tax=Natronoglycomyces albus TaxID=2811108 RepID=A0A895XI42_9ACTN|nr:helix-turn-helix domain-containing protein [Natronoglycomyces albus]QSB05004.1 helix-turn-helix transcriptional regulator [Natronoglycomyces albus]
MLPHPVTLTVWHGHTRSCRRSHATPYRRAGRHRAILGRDIAKQFPISRPAASQHPKVLVEAEVLHRRHAGTRRLYSLRPQALEEVSDWLEAPRQRWNRTLDALEQALDDQATSDRNSPEAITKETHTEKGSS